MNSESREGPFFTAKKGGGYFFWILSAHGIWGKKTASVVKDGNSRLGLEDDSKLPERRKHTRRGFGANGFAPLYSSIK